jgi:hypothetical protein
MNEGELASLLSGLEQGLIEVGLSPLVDQERISAREGRTEKLTAEDLATFRNEWPQQDTIKSRRVRAEDVRIRTLTARERLSELLDLVEVAVGGTFAIETRLRNDVKDALEAHSDTWNGQVLFAEPPESELSGTTLGERALPDESTLHQREPAVREVISLVNRLRELADLPRSELLRTADTHDSGAKTDPAVPGDWL